MTLLSRLALTVALIAAATMSLVDLRRQTHTREQLLAILTDTGLSTSAPRLLDATLRDPDPEEASDRVALALIAEVLDPSTRKSASTPALARELLQAQVARLATTRDLANQTLRTRPTSWRALTATGAATYLERSVGRDDRLVREYQAWEAPLEAAHELAPGRSEPQRFLTMAYLEIWPMLSAEKKDLTRQMLASSLRDPNVYRATIEPWLTVARDDAEAIRLLPEEGWVFADLPSRLARRGDLDLAVQAHLRFRSLIMAEARDRLSRGKDQARSGDNEGARKLLLATLVDLPMDEAFVPLAEEILSSVPSGPLRNHEITTPQHWLEYNRRQCERRPCPMTSTFVKRVLASNLVERELELPSRLAAGDLGEAYRLERLVEDTCQDSMRSYWLFKARVQLEIADLQGARDSLVRCPATSISDDLLLRDRLRVALSSDPSASEARQRFTRTEVAEEQPSGRQPVALELALPAGNHELTITMAPTPARSDVFDLLLDGEPITTLGVPPEGGRYRVDVTTNGRVQLLEQVVVAGQPRGMTISLR